MKCVLLFNIFLTFMYFILTMQAENKNLQQATERLEMELLYMRAADVNGGVGSDEDGEGEEDAGVYKQRYERTVRELEFTRRRLQQQHEDDLEQLVGLKKQLEKKVGRQPNSKIKINVLVSHFNGDSGKRCGKCVYSVVANNIE
jgi:hypothetical protein